MRIKSESNKRKVSERELHITEVQLKASYSITGLCMTQHNHLDSESYRSSPHYYR